MASSTRRTGWWTQAGAIFEAERHGADHRQHGAPDGDVQRDDQFREIEPPVVEIRRKEVAEEGCHIAGIGDQLERRDFRALP
jgi:hypothetical protein